jgi:hypothetical protein
MADEFCAQASIGRSENTAAPDAAWEILPRYRFRSGIMIRQIAAENLLKLPR